MFKNGYKKFLIELMFKNGCKKFLIELVNEIDSFEISDFYSLCDDLQMNGIRSGMHDGPYLGVAKEGLTHNQKCEWCLGQLIYIIDNKKYKLIGSWSNMAYRLGNKKQCNQCASFITFDSNTDVNFCNEKCYGDYVNDRKKRVQNT